MMYAQEIFSFQAAIDQFDLISWRAMLHGYREHLYAASNLLSLSMYD